MAKRWINTRIVTDIISGKVLEKKGFYYGGPLALAGVADTVMDAYRFYDSANTTPIEAQDTTTTLEVDTTYVLRVRIYNQGAKNEDSLVYQLTYDYNTGTASGDVTGASSYVQTADASGLTNGNAVTAGTLTGAAGDFINGEQVEDGTPATLVIVQQDYTEMHYAFTIVGTDVNNNDTITLGVTAPDTPNVTPTITVSKATTSAIYRNKTDSISQQQQPNSAAQLGGVLIE